MTQLSTQLPWELARTRWPALLNPMLKNPLWQGNQINNITVLSTKPTVIDHYLSRMPLGWFIVDNDSNSAVWRSAPMTKFTLTLSASADTTLSIWVY